MTLNDLIILLQTGEVSKNKNYDDWTKRKGSFAMLDSAKLIISILNDLEKGCEIKMDKQATKVKVELLHPTLFYKRVSFLTFEEATAFSAI